MKADLLDERIQQLLDDTLDAHAREELNRLLRESPAARDRYRRALALHSALIRRHASRFPSFLAEEPTRRRLPFPRRVLAPGAAAAAVLLALATIALLGQRARSPRATVLSSELAVAPRYAPGIPTGPLQAGVTHELQAGVIEIGYPSGARVALEGPCRFRLEQREALRVLHGRASVHAPAGAEGFRLSTPAGEIVDLGTEFGVAVGFDAAKPVVLTEVFDGEIEFRTDHEAAIRITRGEGRAIVEDGPGASVLTTLDESPIHVANLLRQDPSAAAPAFANLALGKPVLSPGYCIRSHGSVFPPDNLTDGRLNDSGVPGDWSFWLAPDGMDGEFTVDLIDPATVSRVSLQNTSNRSIDDRGTDTFRLLGSLDNRHFFPLTEGSLPRVAASEFGGSFPFHDFRFAPVEVRYVKFVVTSHFRHPERPASHPCHGGGLNEIRLFAE